MNASVLSVLANTTNITISISGPANYVQGVISTGQTVFAFTALAIFFHNLARTTCRSAFLTYAISVVLGDLLCTIHNLLFTAQIFAGQWPYNEHTCSLEIFSIYTGGIITLYSEFLIAINRIWALYAPHHYRIYHTRRLAGFLCVTIWFFGTVLTTPFTVLDDIYRTRKSDLCRVDNAAHPTYSIFIRTILNMPVFLIPFTYMFLVLRGRAKTPATNPHVPPKKADLNLGLNTAALVVSENKPQPQRSKALGNLVVLAWTALHITMFWAPITIYQVLTMLIPDWIVFNPVTFSWLTTWNLCSGGCVPLVFIFTVLRSSKSPRRSVTDRSGRFHPPAD